MSLAEVISSHPTHQRWGDAFKHGFSRQGFMDDMEFLKNIRNLSVEGIKRAAKNNAEKLAVRSGQGLVLLAFLTACAKAGYEQVVPAPNLGVEGASNQPRIAIVTEAVAAGDATLTSQLNVIKQISGDPACKPQLVTVSSGNAAEVDGFCQIGGGTILVTRRESGQQYNINQELLAFPQKGTDGQIEEIVLASRDGKNQVMRYDVASGHSEWIFPSGMIVKFGEGQAPFQDTIEKVLAAGAEVARADEPTVTALPPATVTSVPTETATSTPTETKAPTEIPLLPGELEPLICKTWSTCADEINGRIADAKSSANSIESVSYPNGAYGVSKDGVRPHWNILEIKGAKILSFFDVTVGENQYTIALVQYNDPSGKLTVSPTVSADTISTFAPNVVTLFGSGTNAAPSIVDYGSASSNLIKYNILIKHYFSMTKDFPQNPQLNADVQAARQANIPLYVALTIIPKEN